LRFPGQIYDSQAGLSQNWHRDYDPVTGRYVESDPIGLNGGINTYAYISSRPTAAVDPTGLFLFPWEIPVTVVGGSSSQRQAAEDAISRILNTPRGHQLEEQIRGPWYWHGSPKVLHLNCDQNDTGELGGDNIYIDPAYHPLLDTSFGWKPASLERAIAHELGHAVTGTDDSGPERMNNVDQNENPISTQLGEPYVRITY